jgi:hypothetical protein
MFIVPSVAGCCASLQAKATAHRCKRDMAWSEDAGRERTKEWMQASDEGNGLGAETWG